MGRQGHPLRASMPTTVACKADPPICSGHIDRGSYRRLRCAVPGASSLSASPSECRVSWPRHLATTQRMRNAVLVPLSPYFVTLAP
jgi:hypothetical protein